MKVVVMVNYDQELYILSTRQPTKQIPRNAQVWKVIEQVTKKEGQKIYPGDMRG
jgi:hypothetical protein